MIGITYLLLARASFSIQQSQWRKRGKPLDILPVTLAGFYVCCRRAGFPENAAGLACIFF